MELQQQPVSQTFMLNLDNGDFNCDPMTQCVYRSIHNQLVNPELGIQYGMLLVWDQKIKRYDPFWAFHVWNVNEDESIIYDSLQLVQRGTIEYNFELKNPIENWKIKVIDGTNVKSKKHYLECFDVIDKLTKPYKGYDAIYVQNFGFRPDGYTQITWDMFNEDCDEVEDFLLNNLPV